jgi:hypothetical protein
VGHDSSDTDLDDFDVDFDDFDVDFDDFVIVEGVTSNLEATLAGGVVFLAAEGGDFRLVTLVGAG